MNEWMKGNAQVYKMNWERDASNVELCPTVADAVDRTGILLFLFLFLLCLYSLLLPSRFLALLVASLLRFQNVCIWLCWFVIILSFALTFFFFFAHFISHIHFCYFVFVVFHLRLLAMRYKMCSAMTMEELWIVQAFCKLNMKKFESSAIIIWIDGDCYFRKNKYNNNALSLLWAQFWHSMKIETKKIVFKLSRQKAFGYIGKILLRHHSKSFQ